MGCTVRTSGPRRLRSSSRPEVLVLQLNELGIRWEKDLHVERF